MRIVNNFIFIRYGILMISMALNSLGGIQYKSITRANRGYPWFCYELVTRQLVPRTSSI
jgi:hypothetical protein